MSFRYVMDTTNHFKKIEFEWKIRNFSRLLNEVEGPAFTPIPEYIFRWQVVLKFGKCGVNNFFSVHLQSLDRDAVTPTLKVVGNITFKNTKGGVWNECFFDTVVKSGSCVECWQVGNLHCSMLDMDFLCEDDIFVVEWSMIVSGIITSVVTPVSDIPPLRKDDEWNVLELIYKRNAFTDVTFQIGEQTISAHKAVLSARSAVFEKMFEHNTLERETSSINIKDFDHRVFDCFIEYIYTKEIRNEVKNEVNSLLSLYEVADKYGVLDLQRRCADILLASFLSVSNVFPIVEIADMHNDKYLKDPALKFIRQKFSEVAATREWTDLMKRNLELASNIVRYVTSFIKGE